MEISGVGWTAIAGVIGVAVTGFFSWVTGRNSSVAVLQNALVAGFTSLNAQRNEAMEELRKEMNDLRAEVDGLRSELAQEKQRSISLKNLLRQNGIEIPRETVAAVVFSPYPSDVAQG